jgi:hypothetical protein
VTQQARNTLTGVFFSAAAWFDLKRFKFSILERCLKI